MVGRLLQFWHAAPRCIVIRCADQSLGLLNPFPGQVILHALLLQQAYEGVPVRIVIGKSRKSHGISTWVQCLGVFLCAHFPNQIAVTLAHEAKATEEIFDIARRAATHYAGLDPNVLSELRWPETQSRYYCQTAGTTAAQAGGTPSFLHQSEVSKWEKNKEETEYNSKIAVPDEPNTIVIQESTFLGRDLFWQRFDSARLGNSPYRALFLPWYYDDRLQADPRDASLDDDERVLALEAQRHGVTLTPGAIQWRRNKIAELSAGVFRQEFPSTPEEAITADSGLVLPGMRNVLVGELPYDRPLVPHSERVGGIDFGYHDPCVIWSGVWRDGSVYLDSYWRGVESLAAEQVDGLIDGTTYYCDPANLSDRKNLERASYERGLHCRFFPAPRRKNPGEDSGLTELKQLVVAAQNDRLHILRSVAEQLLVESDTLTWNEKTGKPQDRRSETCGHYDSIDALKYCVMGCMARLSVLGRQPESERVLTRRQQWLAV